MMLRVKKTVWFIFCITLLTSSVNCKLFFTITQWNYCPVDEISLTTIIGITLQQCIAECGMRGSCNYISYFRYVSFCKLYKFSSSTPFLDETNRCLFIKKGDIKNTEIPDDCQCYENQVCQTGICGFEECEQFPLQNGNIYGNRNDIGSKKYFKCDVGFIEASDQSTSSCETSGNWSYYPTCFRTNECPSSWGHSKNGFRIRIFTDEEEHDLAQERCEDDNGKLVKIDEVWKMEFVNEVLVACQEYNQHKHYWTDGKIKSDIWTFFDNSFVPMTQNVFWVEGKPDNNNNNKCARLEKINGHYLWDDKYCDDDLRFICEY